MEKDIRKLLSELSRNLSKDEIDLWLALLPSMTAEEKSILIENLQEQKNQLTKDKSEA